MTCTIIFRDVNGVICSQIYDDENETTIIFVVIFSNHNVARNCLHGSY